MWQLFRIKFYALPIAILVCKGSQHSLLGIHLTIHSLVFTMGRTPVKQTQKQKRKKAAQQENCLKKGKDLQWVQTNMGINEEGEFECTACTGKVYATFAELENHAHRVHGVSKSITKLGKSIDTEDNQVTEGEAFYVKLVKGQPTKFKCAVCPTPMCLTFRRDLQKHFVNEHGVDLIQLRKWLSCKLGLAIKNQNVVKQKALYAKLQEALEAEGTSEDEPDPNDAEAPSSMPQPEPLGAGTKVTKPEEMKPTCATEKADSTAECLQALLLQMLKQANSGSQAAPVPTPPASGAVTPSGIESEIPTTLLDIKPMVKEFDVTEKMAEADRLVWPWELEDSSINMSDFATYLKNIEKDVKKTIPLYIQGIQMLANCFLIKGGGGSLLSFVLALFRSGGLAALMGEPIFAKTKSFRIKCRIALQHVVEHLLVECHTEDKPEYARAARTLEHLKRDLLMRMKKQDNKKKKFLNKATSAKAAKKIAKLAPPEQRKLIAEEAMLDLCSLVEGLKGFKFLTQHQRFVANALMWGIISYCNHLGRSGEWSAVKEAHVREQINNLIEYIECPNHKTDYQYGAAGKWLTEASWEAIITFLELPYVLAGKPYCLFFEFPKADTAAWEGQAIGDHKQVAIHTLATAFGRVYAPGWQVLGVTRSRQYFSKTSKGNNDDGQVAQRIVAHANLHTVDAAENYYECQTPEDHAKSVKATTLGVLGDNIALWPSDEAIAAHLAKVSANDVIKKFTKPKIKNSGDDKAVAEAGDEHSEEAVAEADDEHSELGSGSADDNGSGPASSNDGRMDYEDGAASIPEAMSCDGDGQDLGAELSGADGGDLSGSTSPDLADGVEASDLTKADLLEALEAEASLLGRTLPASKNSLLDDATPLAALRNGVSTSSQSSNQVWAPGNATMDVGARTCDVVMDPTSATYEEILDAFPKPPLQHLREEEEINNLDLGGAVVSSLLLRKTISAYTKDDALEVAAAKAAHIATSEAAWGALARTNPALSADIGGMLEDIKKNTSLTKSYSWPQLNTAAPQAEPAPAEPIPKKRKWTDEQKEYMSNRSREFWATPNGVLTSVPPQVWFDETLKPAGVAAGIFDEHSNTQSMRTFIRQVVFHNTNPN